MDTWRTCEDAKEWHAKWSCTNQRSSWHCLHLRLGTDQNGIPTLVGNCKEQRRDAQVVWFFNVTAIPAMLTRVNPWYIHIYIFFRYTNMYYWFWTFLHSLGQSLEHRSKTKQTTCKTALKAAHVRPLNQRRWFATGSCRLCSRCTATDESWDLVAWSWPMPPCTDDKVMRHLWLNWWWLIMDLPSITIRFLLLTINYHQFFRCSWDHPVDPVNETRRWDFQFGGWAKHHGTSWNERCAMALHWLADGARPGWPACN